MILWSSAKGMNHQLVGLSRLMQCFSTTTNLEANQEDSNIFLDGVICMVQNKILYITGFQVGTLPIRYLGLPFFHKKWTKIDCHQLSNKIIDKLKAIFTRNFVLCWQVKNCQLNIVCITKLLLFSTAFSSKCG